MVRNMGTMEMRDEEVISVPIDFATLKPILRH
jgi:hypothetical protein